MEGEERLGYICIHMGQMFEDNAWSETSPHAHNQGTSLWPLQLTSGSIKTGTVSPSGTRGAECERKQSLPLRFGAMCFPGLIIAQVYKLQKHVNAPMIKIIECLIEKA